MSWWSAVFRRSPKTPVPGDEFRVACTLYSEDGTRVAEVHEFADGKAYLLESEQGTDGQFLVRHEGALVGPFKSAAHAERFVAATAWFMGDKPATKKMRTVIN